MLCPKCQNSVPENATFCGNCGAPLKDGAVVPPQNSQEVKTYLIEAVLVTLFCCLPAGIGAIVHASRASSYLGKQDYYNAQEEAAKAKSWCTWSLVLGIIGNILVILIRVAASK